MRGFPRQQFWGKFDDGKRKEEPDAEPSWHPLLDHSADVAAVTEALLQHTLLGSRLARLAGWRELTEVHVARLAYLAALHDLGKFQLDFQDQRGDRAHVGPAVELLDLKGRIPDDQLVGRFLKSLAHTESWVEFDEYEWPAILYLLASTFSHHGRPYVPKGEVRGRWTPRDGRDPFQGVMDLIAQARAWFPRAFGDASAFPAAAPFQHAWNGILNLSDWIGSNREFFPFSREDDGDRIAFARQRADEILNRLGLDVTEPRVSVGSRTFSVKDLLPASKTRGRRIENRPLQAAVSELPVANGPSVTVLEAPTGEGKTEAALLRYLDLFGAGEVDGLYFALPTRTSAQQIYRRVLEATELVFPDRDRRPPVVQAVPGYLVVDGSLGEPLPDFEVRWPDDLGEHKRARAWASESSKRFLAGAVVVGTIDQVLLSALSVPHCHLRAAALLRHLLVVDELHASDAYMSRILEEVLTHHVESGGHALLMSATLGAHARHKYLNAGGESRGGPAPTLEDALGTPYPCITHREAETRGASQRVGYDEQRSREVAIDLEGFMDEPEAVAALALDAARRGARVLVIRNTVTAAVSTQEALEFSLGPEERKESLFAVPAKDGSHRVNTLHHSRFGRPDRQRLDDEIEEVFRPERRKPRGVVAIATQTVQQSLDLDADLLISDLCPMDVLLQRIGRLHRSTSTGPRSEGFETPRVVVLVPEDRDLSARIGRDGAAWGSHGLGSVYSDLRSVECTWRLLEERPEIRLPEECRELVELSTHPQAWAKVSEELDEAWKRHERSVWGKEFSEKQVGRLNCMPWTVSFGEVKLADDEATIRTRLGDEDFRLRFAEPILSSFGEELNEVQIPAWELQGVEDLDPEARPEIVSDADGGVVFRFAGQTFRYDRLGLRSLDVPQEESD